MSCILLRPHPTEPNETLLSNTSHIRVQVEQTRIDLLRWMTRRWIQIRLEKGFDSMESWALKEISDGEKFWSFTVSAADNISLRNFCASRGSTLSINKRSDTTWTAYTHWTPPDTQQSRRPHRARHYEYHSFPPCERVEQDDGRSWSAWIFW